MANLDGAVGFKPARHLSGGSIWTTDYTILSTYGTAIFQGDPVKETGTGRNLALADAADVTCIGVFAGCSYYDSDGKYQWKKHWTAATVGTEITAHVYDDPNIVFSIQCVTGTALTAEMEGTMCDWVAGTGNATTGLSGAEANIGALATSGKSLKILGLQSWPENALGEHANVEVLIIEHVLRGVIAGVGGV